MGDLQGDDDLEQRLASWRKEQFKVASQVVVVKDELSEFSRKPFPPKSKRFQKISLVQNNRSRFYGGVDVSFPEKEGDPAIAYYVVIQEDDLKVVYEDYESFLLDVPYVSSYLSFREIDPLERLVRKQQKEMPQFTPEVIFVDGNGILHERNAGIACFLGVRTGIKTIGVGKTLYCHDGLEKDVVREGVIELVESLVQEFHINGADKFTNEQLDEITSISDGMVVAVHPLDAKHVNGSKFVKRNEEVDSLFGDLAKFCQGFAIPLRGATGVVWGSALVGHGGQVGKSKRGTKNPIFISVGHNISLLSAVGLCSKLSLTRIPEPVRLADLKGRAHLREIREKQKI
mmetsp:Transcript_28445/g.43758  ORF Transcript_28445/g.43758 Transcript_28445/m.43758 type:complete len:344 (+) Transcript_28445:239-1270(+)|eukprot:CAMPEP_0118694704 /NCGR_PEP_ID=MMETSP0800-20121206/12712_1 /TAXON_ID=210618 ORGANISM="Striatella unipunctata, Strain CCMP2910" /NCGR_SAMPLE_ID=MMETSP0800 /ASSEMBLY_ACC=CAM_ASM_000638 /LENGTH=343 /DNA_ID=CAMNT_0006593281 /DNA_START=210 /DNA_END=1241 /DNA_ORIENTATION=-